jgi:hypothetical protein
MKKSKKSFLFLSVFLMFKHIKTILLKNPTHFFFGVVFLATFFTAFLAAFLATFFGAAFLAVLATFLVTFLAATFFGAATFFATLAVG